PRGWSARGPIKTESRIDRPQSSDTVRSGRVTVAGIAWAQHTGISRVEVRLDNGAWQQAELATEVSLDTWRMWRAGLDVGRGDHELQARATDKSASTQTEDQAPPAPDGASGWHTIQFTAA